MDVLHSGLLCPDQVFVVYRPHHTKLVLTTFWKMLPNGLKLCANGVNIVATVYDLFKNFMDGLGLAWMGRVL